MAKEIDQKCKLFGFNYYALDQMARQGYGNARLAMNSEEGLDLVEEFYTDELVESEQAQADSKSKAKPKFNPGQGFMKDIQQGLQGSVRVVN